MTELINDIAQLLYRQPQRQLVRLEQIYQALPRHDEGDIGTALHRMREQHLIEATFQNDSIRLGIAGREAWNDGSIVEQTLGREYIAARYGPATVHIIVTGADGENAGSGFFCTDYPGWIVTAAHVLVNRRILRIENVQCDVVATPPFETLVPGSDLDLALVKCEFPEGITPIRIHSRPK